MRSTTRFRLAQCRSMQLCAAAPSPARRPVFGLQGRATGKASQRVALRAGKHALRRILSDGVDGVPSPRPPAASGEAN